MNLHLLASYPTSIIRIQKWERKIKLKLAVSFIAFFQACFRSQKTLEIVKSKFSNGKFMEA